MPVACFSEWQKLPVSLAELCINTTLRCGQSFRWQKSPIDDEWRCVLRGRIISLKQDTSHLYYRAYFPSRIVEASLPTPPSSVPLLHVESSPASSDLGQTGATNDDTLPLITHYFNLSSNLTELYLQWSNVDLNFRKKAPEFAGIRILRQDAWETLIAFICSSNNNITRISQMIEKLCINYGRLVGIIDGYAFHDFPLPEALAAQNVETRLRELGFGYRAKYIYQTALVAKEHGRRWLDLLQNPELLASGEDPALGEEMRAEGRPGYREAHDKLLALPGVGPKVADCICLMGLGWGEAVPIDTHVWKIAQRDYGLVKGRNKSLTKTTYDAVANHFRSLWGKEAGWAHSVLFTADLKTFSGRLVASNTEAGMKHEGNAVADTLVTTAVAMKRENDDEGFDKKDGKRDCVTIAAVESAQMRTISKRLRRR